MLNDFLFTKIEEQDIGNIWFQRDGATCHTAEDTLDVVRFVSEDRIISRKAEVVWPHRSCDVTPLAYYLWDAVQDKCYAEKPETIDALKDNIREAIAEIQLHLLTYLIGHNNPINGFRPAGTYPSRRLCFLRAYASWLHQSMTGLPRFGLSNGCKVVLFADFRRSPHPIPALPEHPPPYERHGRASAAVAY